MAEISKEERIAEFKRKNACFFFQPYPWQQRLIEAVRKKNVTAAISSNKIGKTTVVCNILISWLLGFEPWTIGYNGEDGIKYEGQRYRESSLGIKPPVNLMLTGEDWKSHIGRSLVPELKKWLPENWYKTKRNEQGVEYIFEMNNGSTVTVMSYSQDDDLFESFRIQGVLMDEPPPKSKYVAMSRGLLLDNGKTLLSLTPLKEAWILDDIVLSGRKDIGVIDGLSILDNPDLFKDEGGVLTGLGLNRNQRDAYFNLLLYEDAEKKTPVIDQGRGAVKYLEGIVPEDKLEDIGKLKMLKFIRDIDPADVPPRVFGQFKTLVGRVLKEFDEGTHVVKPFDVPTDWPVTVMIDVHLSIPQAVSYYAVNKQEIHYVIGETWQNMSAYDIADDIIRKMKFYGWNIEKAFIDPLSKGDTAYMRNALGTDIKDTFSIIDEKLSAHGVTLYVASKDKESGVRNLKTLLKGVNGLPTLYVFDKCERWIYEVKRWVFDEHGKPSKDGSDHFMECAYRYTLTGAKYEDSVISTVGRRPVVSGESAWMGM